MQPVRFYIPDIAVTVPPQDVERVLAKLDFLASFNPTRDYNGIAERLRHAAELGGEHPLEPQPGEDVALLLALEHLRQEGRDGHELERVRGALAAQIAPAIVHYDLELIPAGALDVRDFRSYTGPYRVGDVLPMRHGMLLRVVEVRENDEPAQPCLVCEVTATPAQDSSVGAHGSRAHYFGVDF
jgi:hypothetical protein